ncbi:cellulose binding domain-containing protein [Micromonospora sagamiensis]|uniref:Cellulose binding domain-containing protein n=1 Tax=Micromonospora sagamiensis TaxID=47875 RepID=A0A562WGW8_9ACTN|nr:cellulose binding domain-containing protein [Micromonospora sagamiensis]
MTGIRGTLRRTRWRIGLVTGTITALVVGFALMMTGTAQAAVGCQVTYAVGGQWQGGFSANVTVTNLGDAVNGWRLTWTFPSGQQVTQAWNATVTSSGATVTAADVGYNAGLATNASTSFGFNGSWSGSNTAPTSFALNGVTCTGSVGGTSAPPTSAPPRPPRPRPPRRRPPTR